MRTRIIQFILAAFEPLTAALLQVSVFLISCIFIQKLVGHPQQIEFWNILVLSSLGIFLTALIWQVCVRYRLEQQVQAMRTRCQKFLRGEPSLVPLSLRNSRLLRPLTEVLNTILSTAILPDVHQQLIDKEQALQIELGETQAKLRMAEEANAHLTAQLQRLIQTFQPARRGNLHVRAMPSSGEIGVLAEFCNAVLEELNIVIVWARNSSQQAQNITTSLLTSVVDLAQGTEAQLYSLASATEGLGNLVSFLQRLGGTLTPGLERMHRIQDLLTQPEGSLPILHEEVRAQIQLLSTLLPGTQAQIRQAEALFEEVSACASHLSQSGTPLLQLANQIDTLSKQAQAWSQALQIYQIPEPAGAGSPPTPGPTTPVWETQTAWAHSVL